MVSKYRKKQQRWKQRHGDHKEEEKMQAQSRYVRNKESVKQRAQTRMQADKILRRQNALRVKERLLVDNEYRAVNKQRAACSEQKKRINPATRLQHQSKERERLKSKFNTDLTYREAHRSQVKMNRYKQLQNNTYREKYKAALRRYAKKRLQNDKYREEHRAKLRMHAKKRLENVHCREEHRAKLRMHAKKRLESDDYRRKHNAKMREHRRKKVRSEVEYRRLHRAKMRRYSRVKLQTDARYRDQHRAAMRTCYWARRARLVAISRCRTHLLQQRQKMQMHSNVSMLETQLLFNKAEQQLKLAKAKVQQVHVKLSHKAEDCLRFIPTDRQPTEADIVTAFEGIRMHTSHTEPYFWQEGSKVLSTTRPIPVDSTGQAHIYRPATGLQSTETYRWDCNSDVCRISNSQIRGTVDLLQTMANTQPADLIQYYCNLDQCMYETRNECLGHSIHCTPQSGCQSLLRPARAVSCHFPYLRSMIRRIYDARSISLCTQAVMQAMDNGDYNKLDIAVDILSSVVGRIRVSGASEDNDNDENPQHQQLVTESSVMQQCGKSLKHVADCRDRYNLESCDVCEQLRKDLRTLKSCEHLKGFDSEKMQQLIELLYQNKTKHEDLDEFLASMKVCTYCVDKLCSNKNINRNIFNRLTVMPTPDCISNLNLFERTLIKFCMTCVTVVRLGQITNKVRPRNELTAALKGRIAYLPINVSANAQFLPENLLNVDSLVLLVGGQPTQKHKIWTSVVDLRKVHKALTWLRQNNRLYKDIPAYTVDDLEAIMKERTDTGSTEDGSLLKKLDEASKSYLYENFSIQPLNTSVPSDTLIDYQMNKVNGQSIDIFNTDLDVQAFPELFPTGEFGIKDTMRELKISTSDFIRSRLLNKDPKFRLNINYLFHCFQTQEISNMCHSIGHMLRTVTNNGMSARDFHDRLQRKDGDLNSNMFSLMANIRGSKEYFAKLGMEIKWMLKQLGPPTLFITCSTAEWFSDALIQYLRIINSCIPGVERMTPAELCTMDPVNVSIHFHKKWDAIFNKLILSKDQPIFGHVQDWAWRIEYQSRGAPHVHAILWIKDAPILGKNTAAEVEDYIKKIITCAKPDRNNSPTLHRLVDQFQTHKCNSYCLKTYKKGTTFFKKCRFGFPRPVKSSISLNDVIDCLAIDKQKMPRKRLYHIQRTKDETFINDYNPALLLANEANVGVQYIGHLGSRLPYYITDYMSKHERSEQDNLWHDIFTSTKSLGSNAMSFLLQSVKSRQVGANEAADRLLGHKLYSKSRQLRFADLQPAHKVKRVLKTAEEIGRLIKDTPESAAIFHPHWVLDIYPDRPDELETTSLYQFMSWYEKERLPANSSKPLQLKHLPYYLRRRTTTPYIVKHQCVNPHQSDEDKETYYYYLLKLFKPWRNEQQLQVPGSSFCDTYLAESKHLPDMLRYHEKNTELSKQDEEMEKAIKERAQQINAETEQEQVDAEEGAFAGCKTDHLQTAMDELITAHSAAMRQKDSSDLELDYQSLNRDQKRIVDRVVASVCEGQESIRLIISGQGGTGKSKVINILHQLVSQKVKSTGLSVVVAAPTGLAAFNIGGTTIHRLLCLPVEHGKPANYSCLNQDQLKTIRGTLKDLRLLIVDEVSMVSSLTLLFIHMRLTEIMCSDDYFGGISVLFFADFLQLPPVKGNQPFMPVTFLEAKQRLGSVASIDLWKLFQYEELTINMRQSGDQKYAKLLADIRTGHITDEGHLLLSERLLCPGRRATVAEICNKYTELVDSGENPLILLPRTALCDEVNSAMLHRIGNEIRHLTAIDTLDTVVPSKQMPKVEKAYHKTEEDTTRTAGLEKELNLCISARVMLKRNKDVDSGLVNGSVGTVVGFGRSTSESTTTVHSVTVQFSNINSPVNIQRESCSFEVLKGIFYTRKQFPLMLAFAITIHKSQGLSLQSVIVDAGTGTFGSGMVYVALSRVTSLNGLHLIDLDRRKIQCDQKAIEEYNRLRQLYTPHLATIEQPPATLKTRQPSFTTDRRRKTKRLRKDIPRQTGTTTDTTRKRKVHRELDASPVPQKKRSEGIKKPVSIYNELQVVDVEATAIFAHCQIASINSEFQQRTCERLSFMYADSEIIGHTARSKAATARSLEKAIHRQTGTLTTVKILDISPDGNCLFRSLSLAVTRSQDHHALLRSYIVNHMQDNSITNSMQQLYEGRQTPNRDFHDYLVNMESLGTWGTHCEIISAAHLFQCSILCYSKYSSSGQYCLQHFPPHFATTPTCTSSCHHPSLYLINSSGFHYETAIVTIPMSQEH